MEFLSIAMLVITEGNKRGRYKNIAASPFKVKLMLTDFASTYRLLYQSDFEESDS